jgi:hypothetical protein
MSLPTHPARRTPARIWQTVARQPFAVLSHVTPSGSPRSSGVAYAVAGDRMYVVGPAPASPGPDRPEVARRRCRSARPAVGSRIMRPARSCSPGNAAGTDGPERAEAPHERTFGR